jgi:hypothetical protein
MRLLPRLDVMNYLRAQCPRFRADQDLAERAARSIPELIRIERHYPIGARSESVPGQPGQEFRLLVFPFVAAPADAIITLGQSLEDLVRSIGRGIIDDENPLQTKMKVVAQSDLDDVCLRPHQGHPKDLHAGVNGAMEFAAIASDFADEFGHLRPAHEEELRSRSNLVNTGAVPFEVNSFWGGGPLTRLEVLCLSSFVQNGARYHLYAYEKPHGVPQGVIVRDAAEILPAERMFRYPAGTLNEGSLSGYSNLFRYTLLERTGGWWVDMDVCCLRPFPTDQDEFYLREETQNGDLLVASCIFRAPPGSSILGRCLETFARKDLNKVVHGETGPVLLTDAIRTCGREDAVQPGAQFLPVPWWEWERLLLDEQLAIDRCCAIHFWNAMLTTHGVNKNAEFPKNSVFERLKRQYLWH